MNDPTQYPPVQVQSKPFPWGCLIGGCLGVMLLMLIGIGSVAYVGYSMYMTQLNKYTSSQPAKIPVSDSSEEDAKAVQKRIDDFTKAIGTNTAIEPLVLTSADVNALLGQNKELKDKLHVTIADGKLSAEASIPADFIPGGKGRYINGRVALKASLENGELIVTLDSVDVNGEPLPEQFLIAMQGENLAKDAYRDPKSAELLRKFESLIIEDDKIVLVPAPPKADATTESIDNADKSAEEKTSDADENEDAPQESAKP